MTKWERIVDLITSTSMKERVWFFVGVLVIGSIAAVGVFSTVAQILFLVGYFVSVMSISFWMKAQVPTEYWHKLSNTPGHGETRIWYQDRASTEEIKSLNGFHAGSFACGFIQSFVLAWIGTQYELPLVTPSGWIILFVSLVTIYLSSQVVEPTFLGL